MRTGRPKAALVVTAEERAELESLAHRSRSAPALARRARLVLACAEGRDRIIDVPVDHAFVKDVPPTVALDPAPMAASAD